jgi:hypothetical protein
MLRETLLRFLRAMRIFDQKRLRLADVHVDDNLDGV